MSTLLRRAFVALALNAGLASGARAQGSSTLRGFPTAEAAIDALVEAIRKDDGPAFAAILGSRWEDFVPGSAADEDAVRAKFLAAWTESHKLVPENDNRVLVGVGNTGWVLPIPIVQQNGVWRFDIEAGHKEIQARMIGRNELAVIQTLLAIIDAQRDYATRDPMNTGSPTYARRLLSSPGQKNGLYWETKPGEPPSPIGPRLALAQLGAAEQNGYYGYRFRLLYSQGANAPGGAYDYLVKGRMLGGFAVLAWPLRYGETGIMTFMASHSGDVYEQDLGPGTAETAGKIVAFDPDKNWEKADMTP